MQEGQQLEYQSIVRDYNNLYDKYVTFQTNTLYKNYINHTMQPLPSADPTITRTKPDETVTLENYASISAKYGTAYCVRAHKHGFVY